MERIGRIFFWLSDRMLEGNCIIWKGYINREGYGRKCCYRHEKGPESIYAHRLVYEKARGPIPPGYIIHHLCGNRACVNLDHLLAMPRTSHAGEHAEAISKGLRQDYCKRGHALKGNRGPDGWCCTCANAARRQRRATSKKTT